MSKRVRGVQLSTVFRSWTSLGSRGGPVEDDLILSVGTRGRAKGGFANPQGVAVTNTGRILVSDSNNQCVQVRPTILVYRLDQHYLCTG